ncbi:hypothetical protein [Erythrobacter crassostreae]|uniref:Uncharacterized protein n=1 Tax=Erythrobacter crassostreae TaxID=2828328 RepID=A0A9X1JNV6_9SPHN|nr:hypothetical protein [Erythrobacter crassostrea]MBV7260093.1 hypothetical protein [Erythrobacter crassostrea]
MIGLFSAMALSATVIAQPAASPAPRIIVPDANATEFGEWPLEKADPAAVEALFRHEIARMQARFGEELDFICLGYSYGQPTETFFEKMADTGVPLKGRLACSPRRNPDYTSVLVGLSTIRCEKLVCTANTDISFGYTIESGVPISAHKTPDGWAVRFQNSK